LHPTSQAGLKACATNDPFTYDERLDTGALNGEEG
jgi:hypothetical protein